MMSTTERSIKIGCPKVMDNLHFGVYILWKLFTSMTKSRVFLSRVLGNNFQEVDIIPDPWILEMLGLLAKLLLRSGRLWDRMCAVNISMLFFTTTETKIWSYFNKVTYCNVYTFFSICLLVAIRMYIVTRWNCWDGDTLYSFVGTEMMDLLLECI